MYKKVPLSYKPSIFKFCIVELSALHKVNEEINELMYVGRLSEVAKRPDWLIHISEKVKIPVSFVGEGDLYNSAGDKVDRKLHQFHLFGRFGNEEELLQTVLKDIPKQVAKYMDKMNIEPSARNKKINIIIHILTNVCR